MTKSKLPFQKPDPGAAQGCVKFTLEQLVQASVTDGKKSMGEKVTVIEDGLLHGPEHLSLREQLPFNYLGF